MNSYRANNLFTVFLQLLVYIVVWRVRKFTLELIYVFNTFLLTGTYFHLLVVMFVLLYVVHIRCTYVYFVHEHIRYVCTVYYIHEHIRYVCTMYNVLDIFVMFILCTWTICYDCTLFINILVMFVLCTLYKNLFVFVLTELAWGHLRYHLMYNVHI